MSDPWLTIIGLGEDGPAGLTEASHAALACAEVIFGGPRHLSLVKAGSRGRAWPVPFTIDPVLAERGRKVVVLASGDPFWHGAGGSLAGQLSAGEWTCHPSPSTFSLAAARLGWKIEETLCLGLHATTFGRLVPVLARGVRAILLLRDGEAVAELAGFLTARGFGASRLRVLEALGGPRERVREATAEALPYADIAAPVAVAVELAGSRGLSRTPGRPDVEFAHDGQIAKAPVRAITLASLAPRPGELLWDLGAGSGSVSVEWCLAAPGCRALAVEARVDRTANIRANAERFGLQHVLSTVEGDWRDRIGSLPTPDAVFVGGGADSAGLETILAKTPRGCRLVVSAVTLETEALIARLHAERGGTLLRVDIAAAEPLGRMHGWRPARPVVQWSVET